jgi:hypothetical protein
VSLELEVELVKPIGVLQLLELLIKLDLLLLLELAVEQFLEVLRLDVLVANPGPVLPEKQTDLRGFNEDLLGLAVELKEHTLNNYIIII